MKISIVLLNYNGREDTQECLSSLAKIDKDGLEVKTIVVDNNSTDGSFEFFKKKKEIQILKNEKNVGFSGGMNVGIKNVLKNNQPDAVLVLNNDTIVKTDFLVKLSKALNFADIISPKIYFAKGHEFHKQKYKKNELGNVIWYAGAKIDWQNIIGVHKYVDEVDSHLKTYSKESDYATGACMLVKTEVFEKIGLFDESYFLYLEDMDFCQRAKKAGFKISFEPSSVIWHKNAQSSGGSGSQIQDFNFSKSRLIFALKFANLKTKLAVLKQLARQKKYKAIKDAIFSLLT